MHNEILNSSQNDLLQLMSQFKREYYLVGGTAIALHIGHRRSIDFDMFKQSNINHKKNLDKIKNSGFDIMVTRHVQEQMNLMVNNVKITFFQYPFNIKASCKMESFFRLPTLLDLAAMKAYALGRRSKWKDYVDLYFILKDHFGIESVIKRAEELFQELFSEKLFRSQLCYFDDVDYSEEVEYIIQNPPSIDEVKQGLISIALSSTNQNTCN